jgi:hypothetical protein
VKAFVKILTLILFFTNFICGAQFQWHSKKDKISFPFELSHNLIIADVMVNGVDLKMILDTGSERNLLFSFPENDTLVFQHAEKVKIKGVGYGEIIYAYLSRHNSLKIKSLRNDNVEVLLVTDQDISIINKLGIPVNGIIGADFFKDYLINIDYDKKKIVLFRDSETALHKIKNKFKSLAVKIIDDRPYIAVNAVINRSEVILNLLVDTGLGDGLWLFENDSIRCEESFFVDVLGRGLSGEIYGKKSRVNKLFLNDFMFNGALVSYPDSISKSNLSLIKQRNGSLGGEIMKRFDWFFDYKKQRFYIKKNSFFNRPFHYNMSGLEIQHNGIQLIQEINSPDQEQLLRTPVYVNEIGPKTYTIKYKLKPIFEIYSVRKDSPAYLAGLNVGDKIISINGRKAYNYSIQKITDLFQSEEGKKIKMVIEREGKKMEFEFYLEKVL